MIHSFYNGCTKTREGVQAIVDEGANSNTQSDFWRKDAQKTRARLGFTSYLKDATTTNVIGVGTKSSMASTRFHADYASKKVR